MLCTFSGRGLPVVYLRPRFFSLRTIATLTNMSRRIRVRHPGYLGSNTLFHIPAREGRNHNSAYYTTVHDACCLLTGESGTFLSRTSEGDAQVTPDEGGLIQAGDYYIHLTHEDFPDFAITANFRSWAFPHQNVPARWLQTSMDEKKAMQQRNANTASILAGESCCITRKQLICETSHIIPSSEKQWFISNEMNEYGLLSGRSGDTIADSPANRMRLKVDAHRLWDTYHFSIVPREVNTTTGELAWFTQMMNEDDELEEDWHSKQLQPLIGRAPEYLYARFAFDIFPRLINFLKGGQPRRLTVHPPNGAQDTRVYSAAECAKLTENQGRGRSASPTKRSRSQADGPDDGERLNDDKNFASRHGTRSCSPSTSFDSAVGDMAHPEKRRISATLKRSAFQIRDPCQEQGNDWWEYVCGHDCIEPRGRKRLRE